MRKINDFAFIVCLCFLFQLMSCKSKKGDSKMDPVEEGIHLDKKGKEYDASKIVSRDSSMNAIVKLLALKNIRNSSNGEEIRIWYNNQSDTGKIAIIKNDGGWHFSGFTYKVSLDKNHNVSSLEKRIIENEPVLGWDAFFRNLNKLGVYNLKDFNQIPNYQLCMGGGDGLLIEIWKNNSYTMVHYRCFEYNADLLKEVKQAKDICLLIEKEFGYRLLP